MFYVNNSVNLGKYSMNYLLPVRVDGVVGFFNHHEEEEEDFA